MNFSPPSVKQRGQLVRAMAAVRAFKPASGERTGRIVCTKCGSSINFTIQSTGLSRGQCAAACGVRWCQ